MMRVMTKEERGALLVDLMEERGVSSATLAEQLGYKSRRSIEYLRSGGSEGSIGVWSAIASQLGVPISTFSEGEQAPVTVVVSAMGGPVVSIPVNAEWDGVDVGSVEAQRLFEAGAYRRQKNMPAWDWLPVAGAGPGWHGLRIDTDLRRDVGDLTVDLRKGDIYVMAPPEGATLKHGSLVHAVLEIDRADGEGSKSGLYLISEFAGGRALVPVIEGEQAELLRDPWQLVAVAVKLWRDA